jgi:hypothetical protein
MQIFISHGQSISEPTFNIGVNQKSDETAILNVMFEQ